MKLNVEGQGSRCFSSIFLIEKKWKWENNGVALFSLDEQQYDRQKLVKFVIIW